ncbi:hypothetical protein [Paraburkholderia adhaesiva]|uniref:hypothetical protein n=1 Tax=Paraburkholderia adhaesiva TaxID=2883244 RepID=UPI001F1CA8DA|nr:hypothetical protein [Paraburkholderia adhaesiva]
MLHLAWWLGFAVLNFALWEFGKWMLCMFLVQVLLLPVLLIALFVGIIWNAVRRRWRRAASAFAGPLLTGALILGLLAMGLDSERLHFLLVKYPHEMELHFSPSHGRAFQSWSWGLDAVPLSPGVAYTLNYDPTDAELHKAATPDKSIRSMGDHFYLVKESEDGSPGNAPVFHGRQK